MKPGYLAIAVSLFLILGGLLLNQDLPLDNDEPFYYLLGKSLYLGQGYRDIYYPGNPPHVTYPFFYPLLLCLAMSISQNILFLKSINILFGAGAILLSAILFQDKRNTVLKLFIPLVAINLWMLSFSVTLAAEIPYLFFSLLSLLLLERYGRTSCGLGLLLLALLASFFIKSLGFLLVCSGALFLVMNREHGKARRMLILWLPLPLIWSIRNLALSGEAVSITYLKQFAASIPDGNLLKYLFHALPYNIGQYFQTLPRLFLAGYFLGENGFEGASYFIPLYSSVHKGLHLLDFKKPDLLLNILFWGVLIKGMVAQFKTRRLLVLYPLLYLLLLLFWAPRATLDCKYRYLLPLLPFLLYYFLYGLSLRGKGTFLTHAAALFILVYNLFPAVESAKINLPYFLHYRDMSDEERGSYHPFWYADYFMACAWVRDHTLYKSVIMHHSPPACFIYSQRKTVFFHEMPWEPGRIEVSRIGETLQNRGVDYLISRGATEERDERIVSSLSQDWSFKTVLKTGQEQYPLTIYGVRKR